MTDYTPTTDDIQRLVYEYGSSSTVKITWEDFNDWLAKVKAEAWDEAGQDLHGGNYEGTEMYLRNPYREETE